MMLSSVRIGTRLAVLVAVSLLSLGIIGAIGLASTASVNDMLALSESEAVTPIQRLSRINELSQVNFRQLYAATLHDTTLKAAGYHNHPVTMHTGAIEKNIEQIDAIWRDYRASEAGKLFEDVAGNFDKANQKLVADGFRPGIALGNAENYVELGVMVTTTVLPLFNEANKQINDLLERHKQVSLELNLAAQRDYQRAKWTIILGGLGIAAALGLGALVVVRSISRPIRSLTHVMDELAAGDHQIAVEGSDRGDELGAMARAVDVFKQGLIRADQMAAAQRAEQESKERRAKVIDNLLKEFN
ncbi:MAG TPA: Tar ligand binding domain-containing protein, partial [Candidatus Omnitrophota bacterium]|nr:Tar ligand binding domain-containing protein [Candidatus Omnitrophota bacterium]